MRFSLSLLLLFLLAACTPGTGTAGVSGAVPDDGLSFGLVESESLVTGFNPPGTGSRARLNLTVFALNDSAAPATLRNVDWSLMLEGHRVAGGTRIVNDRVGPGSSLPFRLDVTVPLLDRPELLLAVSGAHTGSPVGFQLDGIAGFQLADGSGLSVPFRLHGSAVAAEPVALPEFGLLASQSGAFELQPGFPLVRLVVTVRNTGDTGWFLHGKDLQLNLAGVTVAVEDLQPVPVAGGEAVRFGLVFHPESPGAEALRAISDAMAGQRVPVTVSGSLFLDVLGLGTFPVPPGVVVEGFLGD